MKFGELLEMIEEEIYKSLVERTIASRNPPRKMTASQVARRDKIGKAMKKKKATVNQFKEKFGDEWEYHLWATATNIAIDKGE
jgi:transcription antitermination factor NusA-like protein